MRPYVVTHALCSLDGRIAGFPADVALYYETAGELPHQAVLTGSNTMIEGAAKEGVDLTVEEDRDRSSDPRRAGAEDRPWLVIVDGQGRVRRLAWLRSLPYWRDVVVLCHATTPSRHRALLRRYGVGHLAAGRDRVDLAGALGQLAERYGVREVRVDAGGTLNGALLRAGLVDEVSLVIAPYLVGGDVAGITGPADAALTLESVRQLRDQHVWLRYTVTSAR